MEQPTQKIRETTVTTDNSASTTQEVVEPRREQAHRQNVASNVIRFITGLLLSLLAIRLLLALLGANLENGFADFIFGITYPFVAPFFNLFNYDLDAGVARFELFTLVAIAIYALVGFALAKLVTITQDR